MTLTYYDDDDFYRLSCDVFGCLCAYDEPRSAGDTAWIARARINLCHGSSSRREDGRIVDRCAEHTRDHACAVRDEKAKRDAASYVAWRKQRAAEKRQTAFMHRRNRPGC